MTWRVAKLSITTSQAAPSTWRVASLSVQTGGTWRVAALSVVTQAIQNTWRIAKLAVTTTSGWKVANVSVITTQAATPAVGTIPDATIDPVAVYSTTAKVTNSVQPDSWTWHLGTTYGGSDLDSLLTVSGATASFPAPGSSSGSTVYLTVSASKGGSASTPKTTTLTVTPTPYFYLNSSGQLRPMSLPYYQKG